MDMYQRTGGRGGLRAGGGTTQLARKQKHKKKAHRASYVAIKGIKFPKGHREMCVPQLCKAPVMCLCLVKSDAIGGQHHAHTGSIVHASGAKSFAGRDVCTREVRNGSVGKQRCFASRPLTGSNKAGTLRER
jgi:hypothetical protein